MLELYFFPSPNGVKVAIMLEECELEYQLVHVDITKGEQFGEDFLQISPNNKIPVLKDTSTNETTTLFESGAILLYLANRSKQFIPEQSPAYFQTLQWLFWQVGHLGPMAGQTHYFRKFCEIKDIHGIERFSNEMNRLYTVLDKQLESNEYVAGEYSIVDMACWPWVKYIDWQGQSFEEFSNVKQWFDKVASRPAVQRAEAHGSSTQVDREDYRNVLHNQTGASLANRKNKNE
ncbi:MAG: thiol:disulfide oxidoreductase [Gammaproteobacteria bacterium]|nr:thiol:disulfide oxidoreductase [Gammaproteobacteria bacterium]